MEPNSFTIVDCYVPHASVTCCYCGAQDKLREDRAAGIVTCSGCGTIQTAAVLDSDPYAGGGGPISTSSKRPATSATDDSWEELRTYLNDLPSSSSSSSKGTKRQRIEPRITKAKSIVPGKLDHRTKEITRKVDGDQKLAAIGERIRLPPGIIEEAKRHWTKVCDYRKAKGCAKSEYLLPNFCCALLLLTCRDKGRACQASDFVPAYHSTQSTDKADITVDGIERAVARIQSKYPNAFPNLRFNCDVIKADTISNCVLLCKKLNPRIEDETKTLCLNYFNKCEALRQPILGNGKILAAALFGLAEKALTAEPSTQAKISAVLGVDSKESISRRKTAIEKFILGKSSPKSQE